MKANFIPINEFITKYFRSEKPPCRQTVRNWIINKKLAGKQINGKYYVNEDRWLEKLCDDEPENPELSKDDLLILDEIHNIVRNA